jgi:hypothetical protein
VLTYHISMEELCTYLVEDRVNLRTVSNIRYYKEKVGGYVNLPQHGLLLSKVTNNIVDLQLERSEGRSTITLIVLEIV